MNLPNDCVAVVISHIDNYDTLIAAVAVCKLWHRLRETFTLTHVADGTNSFRAHTVRPGFIKYKTIKYRKYNTHAGTLTVYKVAQDKQGKILFELHFDYVVGYMVVLGLPVWYVANLHILFPGFVCSNIPHIYESLRDKMLSHRIGAAEFCAAVALFCACGCARVYTRESTHTRTHPHVQKYSASPTYHRLIPQSLKCSGPHSACAVTDIHSPLTQQHAIYL